MVEILQHITEKPNWDSFACRKAVESQLSLRLQKTAPTPSQSDINFMVEIFQHMTEKPNIDWDSFANAAGFKSANVAQASKARMSPRRVLFLPAGPATPKKATLSTPGSSSRVKKHTSRVGVKGTKAINSEEKVEDSEPEYSKHETTGELTGFKLEEI
ncbi:hypothetical protein CH63R_10212 [Colletotrichum higginsianum IMI 349063]|uniref:Uncharacterized protein n=1 Tax=Colletotrichum higginsianum (strain IMI 349063) TaxID=759273 RepID=A0A1B7Y268_COLHI|nr:uncharacterized protein CH63R_10212 [Colletotrichum higginsianum IMI 349063]OBR06092.1 hypothetical protein CH63R_10212 [Colletotrichum higginsianum IMI 349063]